MCIRDRCAGTGGRFGSRGEERGGRPGEREEVEADIQRLRSVYERRATYPDEIFEVVEVEHLVEEDLLGGDELGAGKRDETQRQM